MDSILRQKTIKLAIQSIGVKEEKPNWGKWVSIYLAFCNIFIPAPWCSCFVAYKIHQAAKELGIKSIWPKNGYVQGIVNWAKKNNNMFNWPVPDSVFVVYHPELKRYAHIGFIDTVSADGERFLTIEGNSNTDGGREGKEVVSVWRTWNPKKHKCILIV